MGVEDGFLGADGSIDRHSTDSWAQSDITVDLAQAVGSLEVDVLVADTPGLRGTGSWTTLNPASITTEITDDGNETVYRFTRRAGMVVEPGKYVFAVQYSHAKGTRDPQADLYIVTATTTDGSFRATVRGKFS